MGSHPSVHIYIHIICICICTHPSIYRPVYTDMWTPICLLLGKENHLCARRAHAIKKQMYAAHGPSSQNMQ